MKRLFGVLVCATAAQLLLWVTVAHAAESKCENFFYVTEPLVNAVTDPAQPGNSVAELLQDDIVCLKQRKTLGDQTWGFVAYKIGEDGTSENVKGWVGMSFVTPQSSSSANLPIAAEPAEQPAPVAKDDRGAEIAYWAAARKSRDPELIRFYLEIYPNGTYAERARVLMDEISGSNVGKVSPTSHTPERAVARETSEPKAKPSRRESSTPSRTQTNRARARRQRAEARRRRAALRRQRTRKKRCGYESKFQCMKRGGYIDDTGDCHAKWICK